MKQHKNSRHAASPTPPPQQQSPIASACAPASQRQQRLAAAFASAPRLLNPFTALRNFALTHPAAPHTSPRYVVSRTPAVAIAKFLSDVTAIRNHRNQLKTIIATHF
jgi:hypothetical protein